MLQEDGVKKVGGEDGGAHGLCLRYAEETSSGAGGEVCMTYCVRRGFLLVSICLFSV